LILVLISALGVLFIFRNMGVQLVYKITRYIALHIIPMKKRNIIAFVGVFMLIPAILVAIF